MGVEIFLLAVNITVLVNTAGGTRYCRALLAQWTNTEGILSLFISAQLIWHQTQAISCIGICAQANQEFCNLNGTSLSSRMKRCVSFIIRNLRPSSVVHEYFYYLAI